MTKETIAALILMIITYLFIVFVTLDFNPITWHWSARAVMIVVWFYGVTFLEKNKDAEHFAAQQFNKKHKPLQVYTRSEVLKHYRI